MSIRLPVPFMFCLGYFALSLAPTYFLSNGKAGVRKQNIYGSRLEDEPLSQVSSDDDVTEMELISGHPPQSPLLPQSNLWTRIGRARRTLTMSKAIMLSLAATFMLVSSRSSM